MKRELEELPVDETAAEALVDFGDQITKIYQGRARSQTAGSVEHAVQKTALVKSSDLGRSLFNSVF